MFKFGKISLGEDSLQVIYRKKIKEKEVDQDNKREKVFIEARLYGSMVISIATLMISLNP